MQINERKKTMVLILVFDPVPNRAQVVAKRQSAGWGDPAE
jgi:hypothetical protein